MTRVLLFPVPCCLLPSAIFIAKLNLFDMSIKIVSLDLKAGLIVLFISLIESLTFVNYSLF